MPKFESDSESSSDSFSFDHPYHLVEAMLLLLCGGLISFLLIGVEVYLLQLTTSLSMGILGQLKEVVQITLGSYLYCACEMLMLIYASLCCIVLIVHHYSYVGVSRSFGHPRSDRHSGCAYWGPLVQTESPRWPQRTVASSRCISIPRIRILGQ